MFIESMKLTLKHKAKLIHMSRELYPDHTFEWTIIPNTIRVKDNLFYDTKEVKIHWFELMCTYLIDKIYVDDPSDHNDLRKTSNILFEVFMYFNNSVSFGRQSDFFGTDHPIDFMYKKFLKL